MLRIKEDINVSDVPGSGCGSRCQESGFTLIEILVTLMVFTVVMTGMFGFLWGVTHNWRTGKDSADVTENARQGLNRMTRELMQASQVTEADPTRVSFAVNFGDGWQTITYAFQPSANGSPGTIWRSSSTAPGQSTLINGVDHVQFAYYGNDFRCDANGDGVIDYSEILGCGGSVAMIARVDIQLTLSAGNSAPQSFVQQSWLRNRPNS